MKNAYQKAYKKAQQLNVALIPRNEYTVITQENRWWLQFYFLSVWLVYQ